MKISCGERVARMPYLGDPQSTQSSRSSIWPGAGCLDLSAGSRHRRTNHASQHRYGKAVDFVAPLGKRAAIVQWLAANNRGGTMTYAHMNHIHMDSGPYHFVSLGGHRQRHAHRAVASTEWNAPSLSTAFETPIAWEPVERNRYVGSVAHKRYVRRHFRHAS